MDERGFRTFLKRRQAEKKKSRLSENTIRLYVNSVKNFEGWLFEHQGVKRIEDAKESDINEWRLHIQNELKESTVSSYFSGIKQYYRYKPNNEMVKTIDEIIPKLPKPQPIQRSLSWTEFENIMSKAEKIGIRDSSRALLNLLWSEMTSREILELRISDIDFIKQRITSPTSSGKTYHVTQEAWDALQKYVSIEDRGKKMRLFKIRSVRGLERITEKYFKSVRQTPKSLRSSCQKDLVNEGKKTRFVTEPDKKRSTRKKPEQKVQSRIQKNLFNKLVQEIRHFGNRVHDRIEQIKDEKEFKRLLEGYLLATFPDEIITHEFPFKGLEITDSIIDFAVGNYPKIPIEVKFAKMKRRIEPYWREGLGQVHQFLKYSGTKKGILVIGDQKRDPERRKLSGIQDSVYIIVI